MTKRKKTNVLDFNKHLKDLEAHFPMVQILDETGKVVNEDLMPDLKDEELVELWWSCICFWLKC